jgi:hypothetical protein
MDEQVLQCLQATLSAEEGTRRQAEEQLKQLFLIPGALIDFSLHILLRDMVRLRQ